MEKTNKQIVKDIANRLDEVVKTGWYTGDFKQWTDYAKKMSETIKSITPILHTIGDSITNDEGRK